MTSFLFGFLIGFALLAVWTLVLHNSVMKMVGRIKFRRHFWKMARLSDQDIHAMLTRASNFDAMTPDASSCFLVEGGSQPHRFAMIRFTEPGRAEMTDTDGGTTTLSVETLRSRYIMGHVTYHSEASHALGARITEIITRAEQASANHLNSLLSAVLQQVEPTTEKVEEEPKAPPPSWYDRLRGSK